MKHLEKRLVLAAPKSLVYQQWTQFEMFPLFMPSVLCVERIDQRRLFWLVEIWGNPIGWVAEIQKQVPGQFIAWRSIDGPAISGSVTFNWISERMSSLTLVLDYQPKGFFERFFHALGAVGLTVEASLRVFREFAEDRFASPDVWQDKAHGSLVSVAGGLR